VVAHDYWVSCIIGDHGNGFSIQIVYPKYLDTMVRNSRRIPAHPDATVSVKFFAVDRHSSLAASAANAGGLAPPVCNGGQSGKLAHQV
jgi:hypothetical protein